MYKEMVGPCKIVAIAQTEQKEESKMDSDKMNMEANAPRGNQALSPVKPNRTLKDIFGFSGMRFNLFFYNDILYVYDFR